MTKANKRLMWDNKRLTRENVIFARTSRNYRLQIADMKAMFLEIEQVWEAEIARLIARLPVVD